MKVTKARIEKREEAAQATQSKMACPCGWHFPMVKATGGGLAKVTELTLHVMCPNCGQEFSTSQTHPVNAGAQPTQ